MTTADLVAGLVRANLAASGAILLVWALRTPVRRRFGPHNGYALWLAVPAAVAGGLTPQGAAQWSEALASAGAAGRVWLAAPGRAEALAALWLAGVAACLAIGAWRQGRFLALARAGRAGPATLGVIAPRLV